MIATTCFPIGSWEGDCPTPNTQAAEAMLNSASPLWQALALSTEGSSECLKHQLALLNRTGRRGGSLGQYGPSNNSKALPTGRCCVDGLPDESSCRSRFSANPALLPLPSQCSSLRSLSTRLLLLLLHPLLIQRTAGKHWAHVRSWEALKWRCLSITRSTLRVAMDTSSSTQRLRRLRRSSEAKTRSLHRGGRGWKTRALLRSICTQTTCSNSSRSNGGLHSSHGSEPGPSQGSIATAEPPQSSATTVKQRQWKRRCGAAQPTTNTVKET